MQLLTSLTRSVFLAVLAFVVQGCQALPHLELPDPVVSSQEGRKMGHSASRQDLLYVASSGGKLYMFSYPGGRLNESFNAAGLVFGLCTDTEGNIFVLGHSAYGYVEEFAHGSTVPTMIVNTGGDPYECTSDPTTGNLAVILGAGDSVVVVFASGSWYNSTQYIVPNMTRLTSCTYDQAGDLFVGGDNQVSQLAELSNGSGQFRDLTLTKRIGAPKTMQWVATGLTIAVANKIYRTDVSGSAVTITGTTRTFGGRPTAWIQGHRLSAVYLRDAVGLWRYPEGGKPISIIHKVDAGFRNLTGVAVSL